MTAVKRRGKAAEDGSLSLVEYLLLAMHFTDTNSLNFPNGFVKSLSLFNRQGKVRFTEVGQLAQGC